MPYDIVKVEDGYKVCKKARTLKAKKECFSNQPLTKSNARQQQKALYASEHGPSSNRNKANAKWVVTRGKQKIMSGVTAKQLAPNVSQMSGVGATQIIHALKNGAYHNFGPITVSLAGDYEGEGVLNWLNKKLGQSSLFKPDSNKLRPPMPEGPRPGLRVRFPAETKTLYDMNMNAYANKQENVGDWQYISGTKTLQFYRKGNDVIVVVRGSWDMRDVITDIKLAFQSLTSTSRFKEDLKTLQEFKSQYPSLTYYFTAHSLGGAIADVFLDMKLGESATSFNPAVEKKYYDTTNHHRIYNMEDPVYKLMGQYVPTAEVREFKDTKSGLLNKALSYVPIYGDASQMLKGHSLLNYSGGRMPLSLARAERPYARGPNLLGDGIGDWFMSNIIEPAANVAVPAMTLGTITAKDLKKGDYTPKFDRIPGYLLDSGQRLLRAKMGDPSGLIEKFQGEGRKRIPVGVGGAFMEEMDFCPADYDPVTDPETGEMYSNRCQMMSAKRRRNKGGSMMCPQHYAPVTDPDTGKTYGNKCKMAAAKRMGMSGEGCTWVEERGRYGPKWVEKCEGNGYFYDNPKHGRVYCANC